MTFTRPQSIAAPASGGFIPVPGKAPEAPPTAEELATFSLAERAARALERDRGPREIPIDRAFLEASLDLRRAIRTVVAAFVPRFADWCFVDLVDDDGVPSRVEVAPADPDKGSLAAEMLSIGFGPGWATPSAQAIRDRAPRLYREVTPELMAWATHDERHLAVFEAMAPRSLVAVPLLARDRCIGAITVFRSTMVPPLDEWGMVVAEQIAAPAALAIDNARQFERLHRGLGPAGPSPSVEPPPEPGRKPAGTRSRPKTRAGKRRGSAAPRTKKGHARPKTRSRPRR